jgi:hypothetical protein
MLVMDSSDWSNMIRHHTLDTRFDTEFKHVLSEVREHLHLSRVYVCVIPTTSWETPWTQWF